MPETTKVRKYTAVARHRSLEDEALITEKMHLLEEFYIVNQKNYKKYRKKFEDAVESKAPDVSTVSIVDNLCRKIIDEEL